MSVLFANVLLLISFAAYIKSKKENSLNRKLIQLICFGIILLSLLFFHVLQNEYDTINSDYLQLYKATAFVYAFYNETGHLPSIQNVKEVSNFRYELYFEIENQQIKLWTNHCICDSGFFSYLKYNNQEYQCLE